MPFNTAAAAWNRRIIDDFRAHDGKVTIPPFVGADLLLLTTVGAKSGIRRTTPLGFTRDGERLVIAGSNSGEPTDPAWVTNVAAQPMVEVEAGAERFRARATIATGAERERLWARHIARIPAFAGYERMTDRQIPVVVLERLADG